MTILDFLFPNHACLACKTEINRSDQLFLCTTCAADFSVPDNICLKCGRRVGMHDSFCESCKKAEWNFDTARAAFIYKDEIVNLILRLKYNSEGDVAKAFASFLAEVYKKHSLDADIIIPVPLTLKRLKSRGYNQALLLAREVGLMLDIEVEQYALIRIKQTVAQKEMTLKERRSNLKNAFSITNRSLVKDKKILLIDDVFTTGTTADECARVLKKAGVARVEVLTLANVDYKK